MTWRLIAGDCVEAMRELPDASIDAVVTDPPYGIGFMGHEWDQPGEFGPVAANGDPAPMVGGKRRRSQPKPESGNGHARDRQPISRHNTQGPGGAREGARFGGPTGVDNTTHTLRGGAMHAGRYDLSLTANQRFQAWCAAWATEALRVLKPGGHLLVFGGTRTYHRMAVGVEDAGFEVRDCMAWLFGSGFPKSLDVSKAIDRAAGVEREPLGEAEIRGVLPRSDNAVRVLTEPTSPEAITWAGWGTALKPGFEPIVVARKPLVGTVAGNVLAHGTGALNIDGCRIEGEPDAPGTTPASTGERGTMSGDLPRVAYHAPSGRWPANVLLDEEAAAMLDEQTGELAAGNHPAHRQGIGFTAAGGGTNSGTEGERRATEAGGASRFFYCAKAPSAERNAGLDGFEERATRSTFNDGLQGPRPHTAPDYEWTPKGARNIHPTVKPIDVMRWLVRLVTPPGGTVLDPFTGSGTTGCAAVLEGFEFVGVEREAEYRAIAEARIAWWEQQPEGIAIDKALAGDGLRRKVEEHGQIGIDLFGGEEAA